MTYGLFDELTIGAITLTNRIIVSPMCQYSACNGVAGDWHIMHIGQWAVANPGLIFLEGTAVQPDGRITPHDLCLYSGEQEAAISRLADFVHTHGQSKLGVQLFHSGRKGSQNRPWANGIQYGQGDTLLPEIGGWEVVAPSAIAYSDDYPVPAELTQFELDAIRHSFVESAKRANRAGVDVLELHYAHGYLLHSFLSPISNQRKDTYGGSLEARMRFPLEVFEAVRQVWPESKPLGARISGSDFGTEPGAWELSDALVFGEALKQRGCEFLDVSGGFLSPHQNFMDAYGRGFQVPLAARVKTETSLPTFTVGAITHAQQADQIIRTGQADAVAIARGMLYDPRWPWHAAHELGVEPSFPPQYERAFAHGYPEMFSNAPPRD